MRALQATTHSVKRIVSLLCGRQDRGLTAEHCASKKMETEKLGSASPLRVGREEPFGTSVLVAEQQLDRQSAHQPPLPF
jgi:hypothetical protein